MPTRILKSVSTFVSLTPQEEDAFMSIIECVELKKGDFILKEGQVCDFVIFVVTGCVRYSFKKDGRTVIAQFFSENDWYTDYESFLSGNTTKDNVQAMEDSRCLVIEKIKLEQLYLDYPTFERLGRVMAEQALLGVQRCNKVTNLLSPDEYYLAFIKNRFDIIQRIPQQFSSTNEGMNEDALKGKKDKEFVN